MSNVKYRLAKPSDAKQIAYVHYHIRDKYDQGFFAQVNYAFLKQYYRVVLNDPCEVVICAEDENQKIVGFSSGSLDSERQFKIMRKKKYSFLFPLLTSALVKPKLIALSTDIILRKATRRMNMLLPRVHVLNIGDGFLEEMILISL